MFQIHQNTTSWQPAESGPPLWSDNVTDELSDQSDCIYKLDRSYLQTFSSLSESECSQSSIERQVTSQQAIYAITGWKWLPQLLAINCRYKKMTLAVFPSAKEIAVLFLLYDFMTLWLSQENLTAKHYKAVTIFSITEPFLSLYQWSLPGWQCPPSVETRCQLYDEYENDVKHLLWPSQSARSQPNWSILEKHVQLYQRGLSFTFSKVIDYSCKVIVVVRCSVV